MKESMHRIESNSIRSKHTVSVGQVNEADSLRRFLSICRRRRGRTAEHAPFSPGREGGREGGSLSRCCLSCCLSEREKGRESEQRCEERLSNFPLTISSSIKRRRGDDNRDRESWAGGEGGRQKKELAQRGRSRKRLDRSLVLLNKRMRMEGRT